MENPYRTTTTKKKSWTFRKLAMDPLLPGHHNLPWVLFSCLTTMVVLCSGVLFFTMFIEWDWNEVGAFLRSCLLSASSVVLWASVSLTRVEK